MFAAFTLCAFVVQRRRWPAGVEKWVWRAALTGYVIATMSVFGDYYTPWTDQSFLLLSVPRLLISLFGSTVLSIVLVRNRFRPRTTAWLLAVWIPLFIGIGQVTSLGNAALPVVFAFGIAGRGIARDQPQQQSSTTGRSRNASIDQLGSLWIAYQPTLESGRSVRAWRACSPSS